MAFVRARSLAAFTLSAVLLAHASPADTDEARGKIWWAHVQVLADDSMQGRLTGSPGYMKAAEYVVGQFKSF
ncbi:MAG TPA: peptidase M28, partial [Terracidiphilus sp.]